jgi:hypothetical protein
VRGNKRKGVESGHFFFYPEDALSSICSSTPGLEHYEDAQSERSHSPSQLSDSSNHPNQYRRQSIEIEFVDEPVYPGLNAEAEDSTNPSDSEDNRQVFRARERNHHQVIFTDDENDYVGYGHCRAGGRFY